MDTYLVHESKIYSKAHENPRVFSCIPDPIFLESPSHDSGDESPPWEGLHQFCCYFLGTTNPKFLVTVQLLGF